MIDRFQLLYDLGDMNVWDSLARNPNLTEEQIDLLYQNDGTNLNYLAIYPKLTDEQFMRLFGDEDLQELVRGSTPKVHEYLALNPSINPDSEQVFTKGLFNWRW